MIKVKKEYYLKYKANNFFYFSFSKFYKLLFFQTFFTNSYISHFVFDLILSEQQSYSM